MSIRMMSLVWDSALYEGGALLVLLALADYANDAGCCWPKVESIAKKTRLQARQVQNILTRFKTDGTISIERGGGRGKSSRYQLHLERVRSSAPFNKEDEETVQSATVRVHSNAPKGAISDIAIRKNRHEPPLEPSREKEPSAIFTMPVLEAHPEKQSFPSEAGARDPNCSRCFVTDGIIFVNVRGTPRPRPCPCRLSTREEQSGHSDSQRQEGMAASA